MAGARPRRQTAGYGDAQSGQPPQSGLLSHHGQRRLGACLLPEVPEPPRRLSEGMVERGELGRSEQALPEEPEVAAIREFPTANKGAAIAPFFSLREESSAGTEVAQFETQECVLRKAVSNWRIPASFVED